MPLEFIDDTKETSGYNTKSDILGKIIDFFGGVTTSVYDGTAFTQLPKSFDLEQNYPNPFNPTTTISYTIRASEKIGERPAKTNLTIYNVLGRKVKTLVDKVQIPGNYNVTWDGTDYNNQQVSSGIYFYRLSRGDDAEAKKMTLIK